MAKYNQLQTTQITNALKRANQRIAQLGKTYGQKSSVYKQEAGQFLKGAYKPYIGISKSGNIKFDIRAINKLIREEGNSSKVQRILADVAGIKFDKEGDLKEIKGAGVPTLTQLEKRTTKKLERWGEDPGEYSKKELQKITETLAEFSENFQTSYNEFISKFGEPEARKDPVIQVLYGEFRGGKRLTYGTLEAIMERMNERLQEAKAQALEFEEDNT